MKTPTAGNNHNIHPRGQALKGCRRPRTDNAADAVAVGGISDLFTDGDPKAGDPPLVFAPIKDHLIGHAGLSPVVGSPEIYIFLNTFDFHSSTRSSLFKQKGSQYLLVTPRY